MSTEGAVSDTTTTDTITEVTEVPASTEVVNPETITTPDTTITDDTGTDEVTEQPSYKYGDLTVDVVVPDDLREQLTKAELDADALVSELYGGDSFGLSDETKNKLYGIYGKTVVDSYLASVKAGNDELVKGNKEAIEAKQAADNAAWEAALEVVGGEEGWAGLEEFALANLTDEQLEEFNAVMASGSKYAQRLALKDLKTSYENKEGTGDLVLIEGKGAPSVEKSHLTAKDYHELLRSGEYRKDPQKYDAMRRAGIAAGL